MAKVDNSLLPVGPAVEGQAGFPNQKPYGIGLRKDKNGMPVAWRVNIARRGVRVDRSFTVFSYGTSDKALQAAMAFRDEVLERVKLLSLAEYCTIVKSHNTSGIPGVCRTAHCQHCVDARCTRRTNRPLGCLRI